MPRNNYWVSPDPNGWRVQREGAERASGVVDTQTAAEALARRILENGKGGELITQNKQGQIRSKDTINNDDPNPPKDKEN